jgi:hypothetical protein
MHTSAIALLFVGSTVLLRILCVAAAVVIACSHASDAAENTMTIDFVGDWCLSSQDAPSAAYKLPSWTENGHCTNILSIGKYSFYFTDNKKFCEPVKVQLSKDTAPSGTTYIAVVTARCQFDGPVTATSGWLQVFEFNRYKGNLDLTVKK